MNLNNDWDEIIGDEFKKDYYLELRNFLKTEYNSQKIYPDMYDIYNALRLTPYKNVKAVILGQDPYHGEGQAHGLCFSVKKGVKLPPSLQNIYKEIESDIGTKMPQHGDLTSWAKQGVLLLNTTLTVREGRPQSHTGKGWEILTDEIIKRLNESPNPIVYILWGSNARSKKKYITNKNHLVLESVHPSPLSAYNGFFGCHHFSRANEFLNSKGIKGIDWADI
jgi:uracil-DNA glycosylase